MDNRVIGIAIGVIAIGLFIKGIPQKILTLITAGNTTHLGNTLSVAVQGNQTVTQGNGNVPVSPGAYASGNSNGTLPGMAYNSGETSTQIGKSIAQVISDHRAALQNTQLDPELNQLVTMIPASNDPSQKQWIDAFVSCYGAGGSVGYCKNKAVQDTGVSPFG